MMISEPGCYRGCVVEHAVSMTSSGIPQFEAKLQATEKYDFDTQVWESMQGREDVEIIAYLCMFTKDCKPTFHIDAIKGVFGWDGASLAELDQADFAGVAVQFYVEDNEYEGKVRKKVTRIANFDDAPGNGTIHKLDPEKIKELDNKFAAVLRKLNGGPKPVSAAPAADRPAPLPPKPKRTKAPAEVPAPAPVPAEAPAPAPAPKPPALKPKAASVAELTYEQAWEKCYNMKAKSVTDSQLAAAFTAAIERICPGRDQDDITGAEWVKIADAVVAEHGVFA